MVEGIINSMAELPLSYVNLNEIKKQLTFTPRVSDKYTFAQEVESVCLCEEIGRAHV